MFIGESGQESGMTNPELLKDIHNLSEELESLYNHYSRRIKNVSEELSRERSKHKVYQVEIAENHHTIQMLTEQIEYLLQDIAVKQELYLQMKNESEVKAIPPETQSIKEEETEDRTKAYDSVNDWIMPLPPIQEIRVVYESTESDMKSMIERIKNEAIALLLEANAYFLSEKEKSVVCNEVFYGFQTQLEWLAIQRNQYKSKGKERWHNKVWKFLWGKEEENNHPEILKKLDLIEKNLESYSVNFNEMKETLYKNGERGEFSQSYLEKMGALHDELKKVEGYYEEELHSLKSQLEEFKQREKDLERQVSLLSERYSGKGMEKSQRESELEQELEKLRSELKSQSNKKNELYNKMKQQSTGKKQNLLNNPLFDEYGNIPMASDSKRTMFDPNKYIR
ncbi:hypothetical protein [Rossellomorea aquimaris]|uniref:hypothetical protein n=1 Tax=Rossellomorea aquimaris TaxID=189382 RepID=UPI001CFD7977|nr:hypothetical protein [Rossellomorea aquimaris]